jgi:Flp pilus assembly protein TadD
MSTAVTSIETHESNVLYSRAMEKLTRNNVSAALKHLEEALQISPNNAVYLSQYGLCVAIELGNFDAARRLCERAMRMEPEEVIHRVNLGKVFRLEGDMLSAHTMFLKAWQLDKSHPAPAGELSRMGIRRPPVVRFLGRSHWANVKLGRLRATLERSASS